MMERRRAEDIERARARQLAVAEEEQRMRAAEEMRRDQEVAEQAARDKSRAEMRLRALEEKHLGPRPDPHKLRRSKSLDDCSRLTVSLYTKEIDLFIGDAEKRSFELLAGAVDGGEHVPTAESATASATIVQEAEECAICLDTMDVGHAIYTTACGHSFHWSCLKEIQSSDSSNYDKCPSCRSIMTEMQVKKHCDHPRVRAGHRFCRDCGKSVTERDVKPRPNEQPPPPPPMMNGPDMAPNQPVSYRASSHGALVRCPQCHIQMRVLPHMYNMRVACPSGHMFLVQVAGGVPGTGMGFGHGPSMGMGSRSAPRGAMGGYPGSSYYRSANSYSEL
ncbi:Ph domain-containing protein, partial [Globisporangium splendens]